MSTITLRSLLEAALTRTGPPAPADGAHAVAVLRGFAYVCQRCDVYGYAGPEDPPVCWSCDRGDALDRR